jgi:acyl-CoA thioesterase-1
VANERRVAFVPYLFEGFGEDLALFQPDRIHPTREAQARMLDTVWPVLKPLLGTPGK